MTTERPVDPILAALPALIANLAASGVVELEVSVGGARLYLRQRPGSPTPASAGTATQQPAGEALAEEEEGLVAVTAPLSGVFYASPSPDAPPYVKEGDSVEAGQVVALIEAMKVFNEIRAETSGVVARVRISSGQLVRTGQALLLMRPSPGAT